MSGGGRYRWCPKIGKSKGREMELPALDPKKGLKTMTFHTIPWRARFGNHQATIGRVSAGQATVTLGGGR